VVPILVSFTITFAKAIGSSYSPSIIKPETFPCEMLRDVKSKKNNKLKYFIKNFLKKMPV
jgi:hypothetical protein